jgi:hypothetical protein
MAYSDFTLEKTMRTFALTLTEQLGLFASVSAQAASDFLQETLRRTVPLAIASNSEKARSELIIAPILVELREQLNESISLFSGIDFTVDAAQGLNGVCDFLISQSPELLVLKSPVVAIVEAKKENLNAGLGQCVAEMYAAQLFNQTHNQFQNPIYGVVTSGTNWRFLKLDHSIISIDLDEYYLSNIDHILGILIHTIQSPHPYSPQSSTP